MSKLACNIVSYRPEPAMLAASFSTWQAEALLCEAATLLERCVADFKEYSTLDRAWKGYRNDLEILEKEVELDMRRAAPEQEAEASPATELEEPAGEPKSGRRRPRPRRSPRPNGNRRRPSSACGPRRCGGKRSSRPLAVLLPSTNSATWC